MNRILIVEDDEDLRFLYQTLFARQGYEVTGAANTSDAMIRVTNDLFDAIVLDMNMPDMPGIRLIEFARDDVRLSHIPIVVVSANDNYKRPALDLGVKAFLIKPVRMEDLLAVVNAALAG
jgi:two-component system phosphate regulon response regulator PhoB